MKQEKGRGVVITDKRKYQEKCLVLLNTNQFPKPNRDLTRQIEPKIQRVSRKIKTKILAEEYSCLYPTRSSPCKFYRTTKIHKLSPTNNRDKLSTKPIVSNINTLTYQ